MLVAVSTPPNSVLTGTSVYDLPTFCKAIMFTDDLHNVMATYNKQTTTFPIYVGVKQSGNLGEHQELKWEYDSRQEEITVTGKDLTPETPVLAATYTEDGKMQSFRIILISGDKIKIGSDFSSAKLIWIDENQTPRCADVEIAG